MYLLAHNSRIKYVMWPIWHTNRRIMMLAQKNRQVQRPSFISSYEPQNALLLSLLKYSSQRRAFEAYPRHPRELFPCLQRSLIADRWESRASSIERPSTSEICDCRRERRVSGRTIDFPHLSEYSADVAKLSRSKRDHSAALLTHSAWPPWLANGAAFIRRKAMQRGCVGGSVRPRAISEKCKYRGKRLMRATREYGPLFRAIKQFPRTHGIMSPLFSIRLDIEQEGERMRVNAGWEKEEKIEKVREGEREQRGGGQEGGEAGNANRESSTDCRENGRASGNGNFVDKIILTVMYVAMYTHTRAHVRTNTIRYRHRSITSSLFKATLISLQPDRLFILDAPVSLPIKDRGADERYFFFFFFLVRRTGQGGRERERESRRGDGSVPKVLGFEISSRHDAENARYTRIQNRDVSLFTASLFPSPSPPPSPAGPRRP